MKKILFVLMISNFSALYSMTDDAYQLSNNYWYSSSFDQLQNNQTIFSEINHLDDSELFDEEQGSHNTTVTLSCNESLVASDNQISIFQYDSIQLLADTHNDDHDSESSFMVGEKRKRLGQQTKKYKKEKKYTCTICGETNFSNRINFDYHKLQHAMKFKCPYAECARAFAAQHHLKNHIRVHTGKRPFACKVCDEKFTQSQALYRHMQIHTNRSIRHKCTYPACTKSYTQASSLYRHIKSKHVHYEQ